LLFHSEISEFDSKRHLFIIEERGMELVISCVPGGKLIPEAQMGPGWKTRHKDRSDSNVGVRIVRVARPRALACMKPTLEQKAR
jgi:hypothetical protein